MNTHKRTGKWMMAVAWIIAIALLTYYFTQRDKNARNPNQNVQTITQGTTAEVVLKRNRFNHYVFNGKINGEDVTFFLDTGATAVTIPAHIAERLGLKRGYPGYAETANGTIKVYSTVLNNLSIGKIELTNINASINPSMSGDDILLGMSALKNLQFTQKNGHLYLQQR